MRLHLHRYKEVARKGAHVYLECGCGARKSRTIGGLVGPVDTTWLAGGAWREMGPPPSVPRYGFPEKQPRFEELLHGCLDRGWEVTFEPRDGDGDLCVKIELVPANEVAYGCDREAFWALGEAARQGLKAGPMPTAAIVRELRKPALKEAS